jgi:protease-3
VLSGLQLQQRVDLFLQQYGKQLEQLTEADFANLKQAQLLELQRAPANLDEEFASYGNDWLKNRLDFDGKQRLLEAMKVLTLADVKQFYRQAMTADQGAVLQVVLQGKGKPQTQETLTGFQLLEDVTTLRESF